MHAEWPNGRYYSWWTMMTTNKMIQTCVVDLVKWSSFDINRTNKTFLFSFISFFVSVVSNSPPSKIQYLLKWKKKKKKEMPEIERCTWWIQSISRSCEFDMNLEMMTMRIFAFYSFMNNTHHKRTIDMWHLNSKRLRKEKKKKK